ncbi:UreD urease accessory protein [Krasilnikovia cinnamomea]|uniref:Urease accessory protein UreD n=1 Tax=Krasilnikovia cinnamomea TaxID=349313 RepID=A0A4Q7ZE76_9ACTN|nr:urease accessory protein UreD [Krasilnikovia cinnamomea]RZU48987.1 UreD urease accessory protein [Krasilnikovia cinnamomea]
MRAAARIVAEADGRGGTRLSVLRGEPPLLLRRTGAAGGPATVHLVGGAAGPLGGDDLRLDVEVGPGAWLEVRSVAATLALPGPPDGSVAAALALPGPSGESVAAALALPGPSGESVAAALALPGPPGESVAAALALPGRPGVPPSRFEVRASVAARATLCWLPEPLIAGAGCDHRAVTRVEVADGGTLLWRDDLACGRHGEPPGDVHTDVTIRYAGSTLYRHELAIGPQSPGWSGAAVLGAALLCDVPAVEEPAHSDRPAGAPLTTVAGQRPCAASPPTPGHVPRPRGTVSGRPGAPGDGHAVGSVVFASSDPSATHRATSHFSEAPPRGESAVMALAGPGVLATAIGPDIRSVKATLDPWCAARLQDLAESG